MIRIAVPQSIDMLDQLDDGVPGLHIGTPEEGFDDAEIDLSKPNRRHSTPLPEAGADVSKRLPERRKPKALRTQPQRNPRIIGKFWS